jgi:hypothetical protein
VGYSGATGACYKANFSNCPGDCGYGGGTLNPTSCIDVAGNTVATSPNCDGQTKSCPATSACSPPSPPPPPAPPPGCYEVVGWQDGGCPGVCANGCNQASFSMTVTGYKSATSCVSYTPEHGGICQWSAGVFNVQNVSCSVLGNPQQTCYRQTCQYCCGNFVSCP